MLTYMDVHLTYTLPAIGVLALLAWPFVDRWQLSKIALISGIAVVSTTPWDNYLVRNGAWTYPDSRVLAVVGYVPVEEYMFFVVQTVLTSLWTLLCVRWSTPCRDMNHDERSYQLIRWVPIAWLGAVAATGYVIAVPGQRTFYLGCILWWTCPVIAFMWYGAGNYFARNIVPSAVAIAVPTVYLCWVDRVAIADNVWHVDEASSLLVFVAEHLPLEEAFFFLVANTMVVMAGACCDKARCLMDTYTADYPLRLSISWPYVRQMFRAFTTPECSVSPVVTDDIRTGVRVLNVASKSFTTASLLFRDGIRTDLTILYAFCRVTDDMIDDQSDHNEQKRKLELIKTFINELFADRKSDYDVNKLPRTIDIDWTRYQSELTAVEMACFRGLSRIAFYLPRKPFHELIAGYQWDVDGRLVRNEDDLIEYCDYVAGSIGTLCVFVMMYRCDSKEYDLIENHEYIIDKAKQMGQVLQLVNIARDIVTDSKTLGRCYIPTEYMDDEQEEIRILCREKDPRSLGDKKLKKYSTRMIQLANKYQSESVNAIKCLPYEVRGSILAATEIYRGYITAIQSSPTYPTRASPSRLKKILIGLNCMYIKSIKYIYQTI